MVEGSELSGVVTRIMLYHGAQIDLGTEYDGCAMASCGPHPFSASAACISVASADTKTTAATEPHCRQAADRPAHTSVSAALLLQTIFDRSSCCCRRLIPIRQDEWMEEIVEALYIDEEVTVRVHKVGKLAKQEPFSI